MNIQSLSVSKIMLPQILPEIIPDILSYCTRADLPALALVSRPFQFEAEHIIYKTIKLSGRSQRRFERCLITLGQVPLKGKLVRSFQLHIIGDEFERSVAVRLGCALVMMVRLEHLFLRIPSNMGIVSHGLECACFSPSYYIP